MRKKSRKYEIIVACFIAFGVFINLSSNIHTNSIEISKNVIVINDDETIDGKH